MNKENGNISIHTENIFPIIKKWLYSDKDIFVRELISNGCDAISKLKRLASIGEAEIEGNPDYQVRVILNKDNKTIKFIDNGIGMTDEEVKKYINQVAFSGAEDFIAKYKDKMDESNEIIGHFGLGFYSAFMVSEKVEIDTLSYQKGAEAVKWTCSGGTEYELEPSELKNRGTIITLHISEDSAEFLSPYKLREVMRKYCGFLPVEIYFEDEVEKKKQEEEKKKKAEKKEEAKEVEENKSGEETEKTEAEKPINDIHPLWMKNPKDCTEKEYKDFYRDVFNDYNEPLFWIHLNVDYPFNLKGILYFPKLMHELDASQGQVKLYNNQVYVADNIKEIIPEFLLLLKGVIDCSDLPLNVSRSFLQGDKNVNKLSKHITKKVSDKLAELFKSERERYNNIWNDISPFIKYGCLREDNFYEKVKDIIIYKNLNGEYITLAQYLEKQKDEKEKKVFYVTDEVQQAQYIKIFKDNGLDAVILTSMIDTHFISFLEMNEQGVKFQRIDSDLSESLKNEEADANKSEEIKNMDEKLKDIFKKVLKNDTLKINVENLKSQEVPAIILLSEYSRRMQDMSAMFQGMDTKNTLKNEETLVLNRNNSLIKSVIKLDEKGKNEELELVCKHIFDLATLSQRQLDSDTMAQFIERSNKILSLLTEI